jgi:hypothetical protein
VKREGVGCDRVLAIAVSDRLQQARLTLFGRLGLQPRARFGAGTDLEA